MADTAQMGKWSEPIQFPNVPIHTHVLHTGKVLFWGRRKEVGSSNYPTLNEHECFPFLWDPVSQAPAVATQKQPVDSSGQTVNLFCSGHTFLSDGRLLVIGGHLFDSQGSNQACIYDPTADTWTATAPMNNGRWYPTAVSLPDGSVLVSSGTFATGPLQPPPNQSQVNTIQQIWSGGNWTSIVEFKGLPLFPRMHVLADGRVFMCGGLATSYFLNLDNGGTWTPGPVRAEANRDYAPSVMYDVGKVLFIGGGSDTDPADMGSGPPTNIVEKIDFNLDGVWHKTTSPMKYARRQHNATILADGTVLVTGGTQGQGSAQYTVFNDLTIGAPIHAAELWDPATDQWTVLAEESFDRCYHSTAVLLPDATVLSAGGGEYDPNNDDHANNPKDSLPNGQIFTPPYLLIKPDRPSITSAPPQVTYGELFEVQTPQASDIRRINFIRLSSVTHSFNQGQRLNILQFETKSGVASTLSVTAPPSANACPPGHYLLFLIDADGVPSVGQIVQITAGISQAAITAVRSLRMADLAPKPLVPPNRRPVVVGITATCPYGLSACWGGAYHALSQLHGVQVVADNPDSIHSTADVYLKHDGLPDIDVWPTEFARVANGTHLFRGVEVTIEGNVRMDDDLLILAGNDVRPPVQLLPLEPTRKIQWDHKERKRRALDPQEQNAFNQALSKIRAAAQVTITVTGPLQKTPYGLALQVRIVH
jgi:hypothetical protein